MTQSINIQSITVIGRRWFDRINGNTYFSAVGLVDGKEVVSIPFEYGYDNHFEDRIFQELEKGGYLPGVIHHNNGSSERLWNYCDRNKIAKHTIVTDVKRKKDL